MNLTSRRVSRFLTVCAGICAFTAVANGNEPVPTQWWVEDSFETGSIDQPIGEYKRELLGDQSQFTNVTWNAQGGKSKIVETTGDAYQGVRPLVVETTTRHLQLETENNTLTRYVAFDTEVDGWGPGLDKKTPTTISFATEPRFVDTLIKFTPSEDEPGIDDPLIKMAIYVNASSNLAVYCRAYNQNTNDFDVDTVVFDGLGVINPENWHRLTVKLEYSETFFYPTFQIFFDGALLTHAKGTVHDAQWSPNGSHFFPIDLASGTLEQVSFQGTGAVDDLSVADGMAQAGSAGILLTLAFDSALVSVVQGETTLASNDTVEASSTITITAADWYEIASVSGTGVTYDGTTGAGVTNSTGELSAAEAATVTIVAQANTSTGAISTGLGGGSLPANKVAAWALANELGSGDLTPAMLDDYLMGVAPATDAKPEILSIVVDEAEEEITITVGATSQLVDLTKINGTIVVSTTGDLGTAFAPQSITPFSISSGSATIVVPFTAGNFIKVSVE